VYNTLHW